MKIVIENGKITSIEGKNECWAGDAPPNEGNRYLIWFMNSSSNTILKSQNVLEAPGLWIILQTDNDSAEIRGSARIACELYFGIEGTKLWISDTSTKSTLDYCALTQFITTGEHPRWRTYWENVFQLPPGGTLLAKWTKNKIKLTMKNPLYEDYRVNPEMSPQQLALQIRQINEEGILLFAKNLVHSGKRALIALSGGIDSTILYVLLDKLAKNQFPELGNLLEALVVSIPKNTIVDETKFAQLASRNGSIPLNITELSPKELPNKFNEIVRGYLWPTIGSSFYAQWVLFEWAKQNGFDEVVFGLGVIGNALGEKYRNLYKYIKHFVFQGKFAIAAGLIQKLDIKTMGYNFIFQRGKMKKSTLTSKFHNHLNDHLEKPIGIEGLIFWQSFHAETLRERERIANYFNLKFQTPIADNRLVRAALSLSPDRKFGPGWMKYPLRIAFKDILPPEIVWRKDKKGFFLPEQTWFSASLKNWVQERWDSIEIIGNFVKLPKKPHKLNPGLIWRILVAEEFAQNQNR